MKKRERGEHCFCITGNAHGTHCLLPVMNNTDAYYHIGCGFEYDLYCTKSTDAIYIYIKPPWAKNWNTNF